MKRDYYRDDVYSNRNREMYDEISTYSKGRGNSIKYIVMTVAGVYILSKCGKEYGMGAAAAPIVGLESTIDNLLTITFGYNAIASTKDFIKSYTENKILGMHGSNLSKTHRNIALTKAAVFFTLAGASAMVDSTNSLNAAVATHQYEAPQEIQNSDFALASYNNEEIEISENSAVNYIKAGFDDVAESVKIVIDVIADTIESWTEDDKDKDEVVYYAEPQEATAYVDTFVKTYHM